MVGRAQFAALIACDIFAKQASTATIARIGSFCRAVEAPTVIPNHFSGWVAITRSSVWKNCLSCPQVLEETG
jgi:hypothetical protein